MAKPKKTDFLDKLLKELGEDVVVSGTDVIEEHPSLKVPTGCPMLDLLTGGGYPVGLVVEMAGKKSAGKSTLALLACAEAQKMGGKVLYIDAEQTLSDPEQIKRAEHLGVDVEQLYIIRPQTMEKGMSAMAQAIELGRREDVPFVFVVWDTIAFVPTTAEHENYLSGKDSADVGKRAVKLRYYMRNIIQQVRTSKVVVLSLAHLTTMIGQSYGPPQDAIPGGSAFQFGASLQIKVFASQAKDSVMVDDDNKFGGRSSYSGTWITYTLEKSRLSPPRRTLGAWLHIYNGINKPLTILDYLIERNLLSREGNTYVVPTSGEPLKISSGDKGRSAFEEAYNNSPELRTDLKALIEADYYSIIPWKAPVTE